MKPQKKALIFSVSCGGGHISTAKALASVLEKEYGIECKIRDILDTKYTPTLASRLTAVYWKHFFPLFAKKLSWQYFLLYYSTDNAPIWNLLSKIFRQFSKLLLIEIACYKPDIVVSVMPPLNKNIADALEKIHPKIPFHIVVTDPITFHISWIEPRADKLYVGSEEAKQKFISYGVMKDKILVTGIPIDMKFYRKKLLKKHARNLYGIDENKFTALLLGGGEGSEKLIRIAKKLLKSKLDINIIAVCGRNKKMKEKLSKHPLKVFGYTDKIARIMDTADLAITKAGPGTIEECIAKRLPIIITEYMPGQERGNIRYAQSKTTALYVPRSGDIPKIVQRFMLTKSNTKKISPIKNVPVTKIAETIYNAMK